MNIREVIKYIEDNLNRKYITDENSEWVFVEIINIDRIDVKVVSDSVFTEREIRSYLEELINKITIDDNIKLYIGHINLSSVDEAEFLDLKKPSKRKLQNPSFGELIDANANNIDLSKVNNINTSRIISFYSYKGGVGRTIALIQTAYLLAKEGKNVLLMDLDIEAPSFYNIFKDDIKTENGLVDYLYEDLYFSEKTISVSNIISKLNLELKGDIYLIPAGRNDLNYVKRLEKLKEKRIYENKSIQNVIREAERRYSIDYTLVDSRTGINNWGALSLLDISDEVMLFAYPNRENIEGIKLILDLIKNYKNPTIVLSRIDASNEGEKIAKSLFEELNINQEYIPIHYDSNIALAQKYPIDNVTKPYEEISKFILEKEVNNEYKDFIINNKELVRAILNELGDKQKLNNIVTTNEEKILSQSNWIILNNNESIKDVINRINKSICVIDTKDIGLKIDNIENIVKQEDVLANILNIINSLYNYKYKLINSKENNEFINYKTNDFIKYINQDNSNSAIDKIYKYVDKVFTKDFTLNTVYTINVEDMFKELDNEYLDLILSLFTFIEMCDINMKLVVDKKYYDKYKTEFNKNNSSILDLSWEHNKNSLDRIKELLANSIDLINKDILDAIEKNIILNTGVYEDYIDYINKEKINTSEIIKSMLKEKLNSKSIRRSKASYDTILYNNIIMELSNLISTNTKYDDNKLCDLIYGKRIDSNTYSKYISKWIYDELYKCDKLNRKDFIQMLVYAIEFEQENNDYNKVSIITKDSFEKAIGKLKINK